MAWAAVERSQAHARWSIVRGDRFLLLQQSPSSLTLRWASEVLPFCRQRLMDWNGAIESAQYIRQSWQKTRGDYVVWSKPAHVNIGMRLGAITEDGGGWERPMAGTTDLSPSQLACNWSDGPSNSRLPHSSNNRQHSRLSTLTLFPRLSPAARSLLSIAQSHDLSPSTPAWTHPRA